MPTAARLLGSLRRWGRQRARPVGGPFTDRDSFGRQLPTHIGIGHYLLTIARSDPARVRLVPAGGIVEEGVDEESYALVACPCGARPVVRERLLKCEGCERWYCYVDGHRLFVVYGAMSPPPLPVS
jgi:hypothetical protein